MQINLNGKIALVTGASGELGRVMARTLASCGADVVVHFHSKEEKAAQLCEEISAMGRRALAVQADITQERSVFAMRDLVAQNFGAPDIIVNNAVIQYPNWTTVLEQPTTDYESQFRSCVLHNVLMAKAFVPAMIERKWGRVIGINTECAMQCTEIQSAYAAAKRGMDGVLRVLAREVGPHGITVNQVAPGHMISDKYRENPIDTSDYEARIPLRRRGEDQDIANAVAFLASDLAGYISGVYLPVCGGNVMPAI